ncbi:SAV_915 family protein [Streptomyces sp. NPDC002018]|uniref:SAV_915 family protein n=1 Tax=Streptomyces sp. NPDC002018 TaxID=3364629 RepID=UPI0036B083BE
MERLITEDAGARPDADRGSASDAAPDSDPDPDPDSDPDSDPGPGLGSGPGVGSGPGLGSDPDTFRATRALYVPVRLGSYGGQQLRFARTPLGARTAIGFTSARRLTAVLGERQAWIRLAEPVLRALAAPLGAAIVTVDPQLTAPATGPATPPVPEPGPGTGTGTVPGPGPGPRKAPVSTCTRRAPELPETMPV